MMDLDLPAAQARKRVATACEACRATKIRCQPSEQPGVCKKCLESKRECISRSVPRPRRPRKYSSPHQQLQQVQAIPPGPTSTFSIDFAVQTQTEADENFDILRDSHEQMISRLFPDDCPGSSPLSDSTRCGVRTPASSSTQSQSLHGMRTRPLFNLASAESLLSSFHSMLVNFPFMTLPQDASVKQLAATKPFVLLAILSSASGSKTLQGHSLYDEEFRKVLGLKFVAGGERSLELLQGLLIYCAWYPFHLRPKNKQAYQYIRMASDMIHDLELDQEQDLRSDSQFLSDEQLDKIRTYLGYYYLVSTFVEVWKRNKLLDTQFHPCAAKCCDLLHLHRQTEDDCRLVFLARIAGLISQGARIFRQNDSKVDDQQRIMLLGLKAELQGIESALPQFFRTSVSVRLQLLFVKIYLDGGALLNFSRPSSFSQHGCNSLLITNDRLRSCVVSLEAFYWEMMTVDKCQYACFTFVDWSLPIMATILGIRLSFKVAECPEFDTTWARSQLKLDVLLEHMSSENADLAPSSGKVDILSASRIVMGIVRDKYRKRLEALVANSSSVSPDAMRCPMLDGSLEPYLPVWDAALNPPPGMGALDFGEELADGAPLFHDLWTTMTMGWAHEDSHYE